MTELTNLTSEDAIAHTPSADARPGRLADFVELAKLRLNFLVLVTTMVGYAVAHPNWGDWRLLLHTLLGTALTAAAASMLNQAIEWRHDARMPRTSHRPIPAGRVKPIEAVVLGLVLGVVGVAELAAFVNPLTAAIGLGTLLSYVLVYTPLKRVTTLNTIVGAVPGALPPVMGVVAVTGEWNAIAWALFGILFFWQMPHFLAIAIMYRDDYAAGGFKMLPVVDPDLTATSRQMVFYAAALIPVTLTPTLLNVTDTLYFGVATLLGLAFLGFAIKCVATRQRADARNVFLVSILYLPVLLAAMMLDLAPTTF